MDETAKSQNINNDQLQIRSQQQKQDAVTTTRKQSSASDVTPCQVCVIIAPLHESPK